MIKHLGLLNSVPSRYGGGKAGYELNFTERKQVLFLVWGWPKGSLWVKLAQKKTSYNSDGKESACNVGDLVSIPGLGRSPGEENSCPLQYSGLENSMDRGAWQATE